MSVSSLQELYADPEVAYRARCWRDINEGRPEHLDTMLERVEDLSRFATQAALQEHLDTLSNSPEQERLGRLLGSLPGGLLLDSYGFAACGWAIGYDLSFRGRGEMIAGDLEARGYNKQLVEQAGNLSFQGDNHPIKGREVVAQYAVMQSILGEGLAKVDLPDALEQSAKPDVALSAGRIADYGLIPLRASMQTRRTCGLARDWPGKDEAERPGLHYSIWLDTPTGLAVTYKGKPQAVAGLAANGPNELAIRQLQQVRGKLWDVKTREITGHQKPRGMMPLDWQGLMVNVAAQLAEKLAMPSVAIREGRHVPSSESRLTLEQATAAYDVPAERLGFTLENGYWHQPATDIITK